MMRRLFSRLRRRFLATIRQKAAPVQPERTPEQPERIPAQPERIPAQPERTAEQPERTAEQPDCTAEQPERTAEQPRRTPEQPDRTPEQPASILAPFQAVSAACDAVRRAMKALCPPVVKLKDADRQRLGGQIFYGAVHFVLQMSDVLHERPQLSPDPARIHAQGLRGRQLRAICWSIAHGVLADLAEQANDCYLHEQGHALEEAQQVLMAFDLQLEQASLKGRPDPQLVEDALRIARTRVVLQRGELRQRQARRRADKKLHEARAKVGIQDRRAGQQGTGKRRRGEPAGSPISLSAWGQAWLRNR